MVHAAINAVKNTNRDVYAGPTHFSYSDVDNVLYYSTVLQVHIPKY